MSRKTLGTHLNPMTYQIHQISSRYTRVKPKSSKHLSTPDPIIQQHFSLLNPRFNQSAIDYRVQSGATKHPSKTT